MSDLIPIAEPIIESLNDPLMSQRDIRLDLLRLDTIHPLVNGNKWFKLKLNLQAALNGGQSKLLSFGGAYSNHIHALAAASSLLNVKSVGVIRGESPSPLNPVLQFAQDQGMELHFVSRSDYRLKQTAEFIATLRDQFGDFYLIPEGGSNDLGVQGCEEIIEYVCPLEETPYYREKCFLAVACGTGATLAGLIRGATRRQLEIQLLGVAVLKGAGFLIDEVNSWLNDGQLTKSAPKWQIELGYHCGGYGRQNAELVSFVERFGQVNQVLIEPVYTGKLLYGIYDLIQKGAIAPGSRVIAIHTGGVRLTR